MSFLSFCDSENDENLSEAEEKVLLTFLKLEPVRETEIEKIEKFREGMAQLEDFNWSLGEACYITYQLTRQIHLYKNM
jgi:hypothetical protein